ncbi:unnamed protein product [Protopolystoma xenopodis]|uniref:Uncharacterized protein n=1 Tax=Protopolystoma xenopodis TaxID=117903 RepID=A0A448WXP0_9PLAT|nr:unnamed protein product [Protopolystoma xenopodis]
MLGLIGYGNHLPAKQIVRSDFSTNPDTPTHHRCLPINHFHYRRTEVGMPKAQNVFVTIAESRFCLTSSTVANRTPDIDQITCPAQPRYFVAYVPSSLGLYMHL